VQAQKLEDVATGDIGKIRETILSRKPDLSISRVPEDTKKKFLELAEQFKSANHPSPDYGMALKWLIDMYVPFSLGFQDKIASLEARISALEHKPVEVKKEETIKKKMADGSIVEFKKKEA